MVRSHHGALRCAAFAAAAMLIATNAVAEPRDLDFGGEDRWLEDYALEFCIGQGLLYGYPKEGQCSETRDVGGGVAETQYAAIILYASEAGGPLWGILRAKERTSLIEGHSQTSYAIEALVPMGAVTDVYESWEVQRERVRDFTRLTWIKRAARAAVHEFRPDVDWTIFYWDRGRWWIDGDMDLHLGIRCQYGRRVGVDEVKVCMANC